MTTGGRYAKSYGDEWRAGDLRSVSVGAELLFHRARSFCAENLTDGHVTRRDLYLIGGHPRQAAQLVAVKRWATTADGWRFVGWARTQMTRDRLELLRYAARDRQARHREARSGSGRQPDDIRPTSGSDPDGSGT